MAVMILDQSVVERAQHVKRHAERNIIDEDEIRKMIKTGHNVGFDDDAILIIPNLPTPCKVVYSLEKQPQPAGLCHHFSFSFIDRPLLHPQPVVIEQIIKLFGVNQKVKDTIAAFFQHDILNVMFQVKEGEVNNP